MPKCWAAGLEMVHRKIGECEGVCPQPHHHHCILSTSRLICKDWGEALGALNFQVSSGASDADWSSGGKGRTLWALHDSLLSSRNLPLTGFEQPALPPQTTGPSFVSSLHSMAQQEHLLAEQRSPPYQKKSDEQKKQIKHMKTVLISLFAAAVFSAVRAGAAPDTGHPDAVASNPSVAFIQRTMGRIEESTPDKPAAVRFEFYGQSITAQPWTKLVEKDLARRFPSVKFTFHNPAIGGFTSPSLIRTAEHDLYPWYPDILVFHVYGPVDKYEEIIRLTRARTTAEIVLWTSHLGAAETLDKNPDEDARIVSIREIARRYDCMLIDVRKKWIEHVKANSLQPQDLLRDSVHLNDKGIELMASLIAPELVRVAKLSTTAKAGTVTEVPLNAPALTTDGQGNTVLSFTGNRVVAVSGGGDKAAADLMLDGQPMSGLTVLWAHTRPSTGPKNWMPAIKQIAFEKPLLQEDWTLTCLPDSSADGKKIHFKVSGSFSGEDGEGFSDTRFTSKSGRVVIDPADWHLAWILGYAKVSLPDGFEVKWKSYPLFRATYEAQPAGTETVLVQNCANGAHTLTLKGSAKDLGISAFRVYAPAKANP